MQISKNINQNHNLYQQCLHTLLAALISLPLGHWAQGLPSKRPNFTQPVQGTDAKYIAAEGLHPFSRDLLHNLYP